MASKSAKRSSPAPIIDQKFLPTPAAVPYSVPVTDGGDGGGDNSSSDNDVSVQSEYLANLINVTIAAISGRLKRQLTPGEQAQISNQVKRSLGMVSNVDESTGKTTLGKSVWIELITFFLNANVRAGFMTDAEAKQAAKDDLGADYSQFITFDKYKDLQTYVDQAAEYIGALAGQSVNILTDALGNAVKSGLANLSLTTWIIIAVAGYFFLKSK